MRTEFQESPETPPPGASRGDSRALAWGAGMIRIPPDSEVVITVDTLVEGVHFPQATSPEAVGYKSMAVNLSDLAAMGAQPAWASVVCQYDRQDNQWLRAFYSGLNQLAEAHGVAFPAVRLEPGSLIVTIEAMGTVPPGQALRRSGARVGDHVYVTGTLGDAGVALAAMTGRIPGLSDEDALRQLRRRLDYPQPRVAVGIALRGLASAAIDISDGLAADLGHILTASTVGAVVDLKRLPLSVPVSEALEPTHAWRYALHAGDDYELCFTAPPQHHPEIKRLFQALECSCTVVGKIDDGSGLRLTEGGVPRSWPGEGGYEHFRGSTV